MDTQIHTVDTPRWQESVLTPEMRSTTELPRSESFESLLSLNMLASSLLDEATDLEELSQDRHITLPYFSTQVVGSQPYRFNNVASSKGDKGKGVSFESREASFKPHEPKRRVGHNRQDSTATTSSSVPGSQDYDSFLSRSTATHSTRNTSYGSQVAFTKPGAATSYLPPAVSSLSRERLAMPDATQARRPSEVDSVKEGRPFSSLATVAGVQEEEEDDAAFQTFRTMPRSSTASKIGDWLRQQYENGTRSSHSTPSSVSLSTLSTPLQPSDDEPPQPGSSRTTPASVNSESRSASKVFGGTHRRGTAYRTSSQRFRQALLEEIIETDFADVEARPLPSSRHLLWHPSEYVGPIRRSKTTAGSTRPANHRRHRSADLLQEAQPASSQKSAKRYSWPANPVGRASMNDLLLRPANDPTRQSAEKDLKRKKASPSFGNRPSQKLSRSFSSLTSFFGLKSNAPGAAISPPGISSNGTFVVYNHQHPRTRTPSFVVYSRSPPPQNAAQLPDIDVGEETERPALASPILLDNTDSRDSDQGDSSRSQSQYQSTLSRYRRSLKRLASMKRQPRAEAFQVSERRKAETGRLAELAQEQVARDASVRAQIVDRFSAPLSQS